MTTDGLPDARRRFRGPPRSLALVAAVTLLTISCGSSRNESQFDATSPSEPSTSSLVPTPTLSAEETESQPDGEEEPTIGRSDCAADDPTTAEVLAPDLLQAATKSGARNPVATMKTGRQENPIVEVQWPSDTGRVARLTYSVYPAGTQPPDITRLVIGSTVQNPPLQSFETTFGEATLSTDQEPDEDSTADPVDTWYRLTWPLNDAGDQAFVATSGVTKNALLTLAHENPTIRRYQISAEEAPGAPTSDLAHLLGLTVDLALIELDELEICGQVRPLIDETVISVGDVVVGYEQNGNDVVTLMSMPADLAAAQGFALREPGSSDDTPPADEAGTNEPDVASASACDVDDLGALEGFVVQLAGQDTPVLSNQDQSIELTNYTVSLSPDLETVSLVENTLTSSDGLINLQIDESVGPKTVTWMDDGILVTYVTTGETRKVEFYSHNGTLLWNTKLPDETGFDYASGVSQSLSTRDTAYLVLAQPEMIRGYAYYKVIVDSQAGSVSGPLLLPNETSSSFSPLVIDPTNDSLLSLIDETAIAPLDTDTTNRVNPWEYPIRDVIAQTGDQLLVTDDEGHYARVDLTDNQATNITLPDECQINRNWRLSHRPGS